MPDEDGDVPPAHLSDVAGQLARLRRLLGGDLDLLVVLAATVSNLSPADAPRLAESPVSSGDIARRGGLSDWEVAEKLAVLAGRGLVRIVDVNRVSITAEGRALLQNLNVTLDEE